MNNPIPINQKKSQAPNPIDPNSYKLAKRPITEIIADLSKTIPDKYLDYIRGKKTQSGKKIWYIPWHKAVILLNHCTGGHWDYEIKNITLSPEHLFLIARITIYAQEGNFYKEASGMEFLRFKKADGTILDKLPIGDPSSNAESMALRRAAAKFGLALYLYNEED